MFWNNNAKFHSASWITEYHKGKGTGKYEFPLYQQSHHIILQPGITDDIHYSQVCKSTQHDSRSPRGNRMTICVI